MNGRCIWLTGLPCSGKTTLARALEKHFPRVTLLDGDVIRDTPLGSDVGFSPEDRRKHILRMGQLAKMLVDAGQTVLCAFVSPEQKIRDQVRSMFGQAEYYEIYCAAPLSVCEQRDVKGMYAKARNGEISQFTGVDAPYDVPDYPDLSLDTGYQSVSDCVDLILLLSGRKLERKTRWHWYFGRWNGIFHNGHDAIIQKSLTDYPDDMIMLAIRDVAPDEKNPWTACEVKEMLEYRFAGEPRVVVSIVPDIASVEYGRGVGYEVNEIAVSTEIASISGTKCREMMLKGEQGWKQMVPSEIVRFLEQKYHG